MWHFWNVLAKVTQEETTKWRERTNCRLSHKTRAVATAIIRPRAWTRRDEWQWLRRGKKAGRKVRYSPVLSCYPGWVHNISTVVLFRCRRGKAPASTVFRLWPPANSVVPPSAARLRPPSLVAIDRFPARFLLRTKIKSP